MAKPMMLQDHDDQKIEKIKRQIGCRTKIDVIREGLKLLEQKIDRQDKISQWKQAAKLASKSSLEILREFQPNSRFKKDE